MITELNKLDHTILDENKKCMLMLIFDSKVFWRVNQPNNFNLFRYKRMLKDKEIEHLVYLKNKVENYVKYILNDGIIKSFPKCADYKNYCYEIRIVTDFIPDNNYLELINKLNTYIANSVSGVIVTYEKRENS